MKALKPKAAIFCIGLFLSSINLYAQDSKALIVKHTHFLSYSSNPFDSLYQFGVEEIPNYFEDTLLVRYISNYTQQLLKERLGIHNLEYKAQNLIDIQNAKAKTPGLKRFLKNEVSNEAEIFIAITSYFRRPTETEGCCMSLNLEFRAVNAENKRIDKEMAWQQFIPVYDSTLTGRILISKEEFLRLYEKGLYTLFLGSSFAKEPLLVLREQSIEHEGFLSESEVHYLSQEATDWIETRKFKLFDKQHTLVEQYTFDIDNYSQGGFWTLKMYDNSGKTKIKGTIITETSQEELPISIKVKARRLFNTVGIAVEPKIEVREEDVFSFSRNQMQANFKGKAFTLNYDEVSGISQLKKGDKLIALIQQGPTEASFFMDKVFLHKDLTASERDSVIHLFMIYSRAQDMWSISDQISDTEKVYDED